MNEFSNFFDVVLTGRVDPRSLNAADWSCIINDCLKSCKSLLPQAALKKGKSFKDLLQYSIGSGGKEKRITPEEIVASLPKALITNTTWLFIPVETLESREEKGQFFERKLFVVADLACLMIMDVAFRKEPLPDQEMKIDTIPKINENVVACQIFIDYDGWGFSDEGFKEKIIPYLLSDSKDCEMKLGEKIVKYTLDDVIRLRRDMRAEAEKREKELKTFLEIRARLGWVNL